MPCKYTACDTARNNEHDHAKLYTQVYVRSS